MRQRILAAIFCRQGHRPIPAHGGVFCIQCDKRLPDEALFGGAA